MNLPDMMIVEIEVWREVFARRVVGKSRVDVKEGVYKCVTSLLTRR